MRKTHFQAFSAILPGFSHFRRLRAFSKLAKNYKKAQKRPKMPENARKPQQTCPACPTNPPQWTQTASIDGQKNAFSGIFAHFHEKRLSIWGTQSRRFQMDVTSSIFGFFRIQLCRIKGNNQENLFCVRRFSHLGSSLARKCHQRRKKLKTAISQRKILENVKNRKS